MNTNINMSDKEQKELIKDWWKKHGTFVIFLITFFLLANIGISYWKKYRVQYSDRASTAYTQLLNSQQQGKKSEVNLFAQDLMKNYSRSVYSSLAAMILAKNNVIDSKLDDAVNNLQWVIKNSNNGDLKNLAKIRKSRILLAQNKLTQALDSANLIKDKNYLPAVGEIKGDVLLAMGKKKEASNSYNDALGVSIDIKTKSPLLEMKANSIVLEK